MAPVDQNDLECFIHADNDTYIHLDIKLYFRGRLISASGKNVDFTDPKDVTTNFHQSLFSQCYATLIGVTLTQASEHYHYRTYFETLMTYGTEAAATHLSNVNRYIDTGDMQPSGFSAKNLIASAYRGFITRWHRFITSREVELFRRFHSDICNLNLYFLPGDR